MSMFPAFDTPALFATADWMVEWLTLYATKAALVFGVAACVAFALRRTGAAVRHLVWAGAVFTALGLPVLSVALPAVDLGIGILPARTQTPAGPPEIVAPGIAQAASPAVPTSEPAVVSRSALVAPVPAASVSLDLLLLAVWIAGVLVVLVRSAAGHAAARSLIRHAQDAPRNWDATVERASRRLGVAPSPRVLLSNSIATPCTWGVARPAVLLPSEASTWDRQQVELVLLHEFAHVARRDCLVHAAAQVALALNWFDPLAWLAIHRVRVEREYAADEAVVNTGARPSDYAQQLLVAARSVARSTRARRLDSAIGMARRSQIEHRIVHILAEPSPSRSLRRTSAAAVLLVALLGAPLLSSLELRAIAGDGQPSAGRQIFVVPGPSVPGETASTYDSSPAKADDGVSRTQGDTGVVGLVVDAPPALAAPASTPAATSPPQSSEHEEVLSDEEVVAALEAALSDPDPSVRKQAAWSLKLIRTRNHGARSGSHGCAECPGPIEIPRIEIPEPDLDASEDRTREPNNQEE